MNMNYHDDNQPRENTISGQDSSGAEQTIFFTKAGINDGSDEISLVSEDEKLNGVITDGIADDSTKELTESFDLRVKKLAAVNVNSIASGSSGSTSEIQQVEVNERVITIEGDSNYDKEKQEITEEDGNGDTNEDEKEGEAVTPEKSFKLFKNFTITKKLLVKIIILFIILIITAILLGTNPFKNGIHSRSLALLILISLLYATETFPLYATSLLTPLLIVLFKILKNEDGTPMKSPEAANYILSTMWSSVIMVLFGGFVLAAALTKYQITSYLSSKVLLLAGTNPKILIGVVMCISCFLSMWISNVASPVICFSLMDPILSKLYFNDPFAQALILGIALAANVGGMTSPISSPQNIIALQSMGEKNPGWGGWFEICLPIAIVSLFLIWLELIFTFKLVKRVKFTSVTLTFTWKHFVIILTTIATIVLWCVLSKLQSVFGQPGIISFIPIFIFFSLGILDVSDLNNIPWNIILLAMGGISLGKAVSSSGLLTRIAMSLLSKIDHLHIWLIFMIFGLLMLVVATFVSHTVAALILVPLVQEIGDKLPTNHSNLLVMGAALLASGAMGLPMSGFPNVTAISKCDKNKRPYLTSLMFITRGVPASLIAYLLVVSLGYGIMIAMGY